MDLPNELFFFQCKFFTFELDDLEFFFVFTWEFSKLEFPVSEGIGLQLVLFIDRHDLLQLSLLPCHICQKRPVLADKLGVFSLNLVQLDTLIFLTLSDLSQVNWQAFEVLSLFRL